MTATRNKTSGFYIDSNKKYCYVLKNNFGYTVYYKASPMRYIEADVFNRSNEFVVAGNYFTESNPEVECHVYEDDKLRAVLFSPVDAWAFFTHVAKEYERKGSTRVLETQKEERKEFTFYVSGLGNFVKKGVKISSNGSIDTTFLNNEPDYVKDQDTLTSYCGC